jgi:hypothetical protein
MPADIRQVPFDCPHCGARIGLSAAPLFAALIVGFGVSVWVVQLLGLRAYAALLWLPILVVCVRYSLPLVGPMFFRLIVQNAPSGTSDSYKSTLRLFLVWWFVLILFAVVYGTFIGAVPFLLGAPTQEAVEATDIFSLPLGLLNPKFMIRPDKSLAEVIGIITANSYFWALGLTMIFKVVHGFIRRSRVTQLGISSTTMNDDDELL